MRTRSNGLVCNQSITRRTARLALAIALSSGAWANVWADLPLPAFPTNPAEAVSEGSGLLPYPFAAGVQNAPSLGQAGSGIQAGAVGRSATSRQLVQLLGLRRQATENKVVENKATENKATENSTANLVGVAQPVQPQLPTLPAMPQFNASIATAPTMASEVIPASATDQQLVSDTLPKPPEPAQATGDAASHNQLCELLLDIQIPASVAIDGPQLSTAGTQVAKVGSGDAKKTDPMDVDRNSRNGVVQACETPSLLGSESIPPAQPKSALLAKQPELLRLSKPLSVAASKSEAPAGPVKFNLNDAPAEIVSGTAPPQKLAEKNGQASGRGAVLHLSSGSDDVTIHQATKSSTPSSRTPKPMMQVRIEGEPAPAIAGMAIPTDALVRPAAPLPLMEAGSFPSSVSTASRSSSTQSMGGANSSKPVNALLALHTVTGPSVGEEAGADPQVRSQALGLVSLRLQESQAISTDYVISELSVEHPSICQLLRTSDRSVSVIGMRVGTTRIALISTDASGQRRIEVRDVTVNADARGEVNLAHLAREISQTVNQLYPKSDVQIVVYEDRLMVRGYTNYESDAKKILALVRKTSLAPVVDQLTTSGN
jgi:hypothetical protein